MKNHKLENNSDDINILDSKNIDNNINNLKNIEVDLSKQKIKNKTQNTKLQNGF